MDTLPPRAQFGDRGLFPTLEYRAYLNHASVSPPSTAVQEAVAHAAALYARLGRDAFVEATATPRERLRTKLGQLLHAAPTDIALVPNTSQGVGVVAWCFPWQPGDHVVLFEGEFPANVTPWQQAAASFDLKLEFLPLKPFERSPEEGLARLRQTLERGVRMVAVSAVQFQTGLRMPLSQMAACCHEHGAQLCVDAIQACGVVPLRADRDGFDYLASGGHKWLMGPMGLGFLYARPKRAAALVPRLAGWTSHEDPFMFLTEPGQLRYDRPMRTTLDFVEGGTPNPFGIAGLEAALDLILALGVPHIFDHVSRYLDRLEAGLLGRGFHSARKATPDQRSGILSVRSPAAEPPTLQARLAERGIATSTPDGWLRFAPHWPNSMDEVDLVLRELV